MRTKKRASSNWRHYSKEQRAGPCSPWIKGPTLFQNTQKKRCIVFVQPAANNGWTLNKRELRGCYYYCYLC